MLAIPNVDKIEIRAFKDKKFNDEINKSNPYKLPINPESYSKNYQVEYDKSKAQGSEGTDPKYTGTAPEELKLEFIFDGTKTIEGNINKNKKVSDQIFEFLDTVYFMEGEIHKPKFLKVIWGSLFTFDCILTNLDINYTLFQSDGEPLRAKLSASFLAYCNPELRVKKEGKKSPDLTHMRTVVAGDKLPFMTYKIYGDDQYYLQIAKVNQLTSFRQLKVGQNLTFPSIDKTTIDE